LRIRRNWWCPIEAPDLFASAAIRRSFCSSETTSRTNSFSMSGTIPESTF
jgi:hypothetical protein